METKQKNLKIASKNLQNQITHYLLLLAQRNASFLSINWSKKGDEIILPTQTHVATAHAIEAVGGNPFLWTLIF